MNPALLLVGALVLLYAAATGRAEAVWTALTNPGSSSTRSKSSSGSGSSTNPATKSTDSSSGGSNGSGTNWTTKP